MRKAACFLLLVSLAWAQKKEITLEVLRESSGRRGEERVWAPDGKSFAVRQKQELKIYDARTQSERTLVAFSTLDAAAVKPPSGQRPFDWTNRNATTEEMTWSADSQSLLCPNQGDVFLVNAASGKVEQLTRTPDREIDPKLSPDGRKVVFRRGWDLYTVEVASKKETRLTSGGSEELRNGGLDWVYPEEIGLSTAFWWSPDSRWIAYLQFDTS
ncbi:MAG: DPP IV N-terminal domain-containing protein, partial [Acidobacteriia bacterium]|nr:DPP IV N-terminal domain-containing protein [Terriglobia bacterium]